METKVTIKKENFIEFVLKGNIVIVTYEPKEMSEMFYTAKQTTTKLNKNMTYDEIVAKLIHTIYSSDAELSLINNAISDLSNISDNKEYLEYQSWRAKCKEAAKQYLNKNELLV